MVTKDTYQPKYDNTVTVTLGEANSPKVPVNPRYCLTPESAEELKDVLNENGFGPVHIEFRFPDEDHFVRFVYSKTVPWFVYRNGATENAAFVAWNWIPNRNGIVALFYASYEINGVMRDYETVGV